MHTPGGQGFLDPGTWWSQLGKGYGQQPSSTRPWLTQYCQAAEGYPPLQPSPDQMSDIKIRKRTAASAAKSQAGGRDGKVLIQDDAISVRDGFDSTESPAASASGLISDGADGRAERLIQNQ